MTRRPQISSLFPYTTYFRAPRRAPPAAAAARGRGASGGGRRGHPPRRRPARRVARGGRRRSEEHTAEIPSPPNLGCRFFLEKKNTISGTRYTGVYELF